MAQIIDLLIIDDNKDFCNSLKNTAYRVGKNRNWEVYVTDFQNLEEGFAEFVKEIKYKGVILDGKCVIKKGENENFAFLPMALDQLSEINRQTGRIYTPFVVNTGYYGYDQIKLFTPLIEEKKGKIFDKTDESVMLNFLFDAVAVSPETKTEIEHEHIFDIFNKNYLNSSLRQTLHNLINAQIKNAEEQKEKFNVIRQFFEAVLIKLKEKNSTIFPDRCLHERTGLPNLNWIFFYFNGKVKYPDRREDINPEPLAGYLQYIFKFITDITNEGSHYNENVPNYHYKSVLTAFFEILVWFKTEMEK